MVEAFLPGTPQEALTDRVVSGSMNRRFEQLNRTGGRYTSKARPKFAIVITDQIFRRLSIGSRFSELLGHPGIGGERVTPTWFILRECSSMTKKACELSQEQIGDL